MPRLYGALSAVIAILCVLSTSLSAQSVRFTIGMNAGASRLYHDTHFGSTNLRQLYETIELTHTEEYPWEQFAHDFKLRNRYTQPRFGLSLVVTHRDWPIILIGDAMSSTSSYEKMAYSVTAGLGKEFFTFQKEYSFYFLGGYKVVWDKGFGSNTLVNSIGHNEARNLVASYFDPKKPLGQQRGGLFVLRGAAGKTLDRDKKMTLGVEAYGELDVTPTISRDSRMTNIGLHLFFRFSINRTKDDAKWLPDYYYRG